ncbi:MAG: hypothetical protein M3Q60_16955 [Actinomycetota bacterium]|nr:hypothetical protein [Actinomycetota bacterium]
MTEPPLVLAAAAGTASFLSPCMLPVIPAFLGASELKRRDVFPSAVAALRTYEYEKVYVKISMRSQANRKEKIV